MLRARRKRGRAEIPVIFLSLPLSLSLLRRRVPPTSFPPSDEAGTSRGHVSSRLKAGSQGAQLRLRAHTATFRSPSDADRAAAGLHGEPFPSFSVMRRARMESVRALTFDDAEATNRRGFVSLDATR